MCLKMHRDKEFKNSYDEDIKWPSRRNSMQETDGHCEEKDGKAKKNSKVHIEN